MRATSVQELTEGEGAVLMAVRLWSRGGSMRTMAAIRTVFRNAGLPVDALLPLFALLGVFAAARTRPVEALLPGNPSLSVDEAALLEAMGGFQHGDEEAAAGELGRWLPMPVRCMAIDPACEFGRILARSGVFLPWRRVPTSRLALAAE